MVIAVSVVHLVHPYDDPTGDLDKTYHSVAEGRQLGISVRETRENMRLMEPAVTRVSYRKLEGRHLCSQRTLDPLELSGSRGPLIEENA